MPTLTFEQSIPQCADKVLRALGRIDLYQNFITGCIASTVEHVAVDSAGVIDGVARLVFEVRRYGVSEEAAVAFTVDRVAGTVSFRFDGGDKGVNRIKAVYSVIERGADTCDLELELEYTKPGRRFFWIPVKIIGRRLFLKFAKQLETRATTLPAEANWSFGSNTERPQRKVRGFQRHDRSKQQARMQILNSLPANSVGAEVGTYMGAFAHFIVETVAVKKLYLIDPWMASAGDSRAGSWYESIDQPYMDEIHEMVCQRFESYLEKGIVQIERDTSSNVLSAMNDSYLDWVYIDGDHSYAAVKEDLELSFAKVRNGGFIAGDDYMEVDGWWKDNVVRAVDEFIAEHPVRLVFAAHGQFLLQKE